MKLETLIANNNNKIGKFNRKVSELKIDSSMKKIQQLESLLFLYESLDTVFNIARCFKIHIIKIMQL